MIESQLGELAAKKKLKKRQRDGEGEMSEDEDSQIDRHDELAEGGDHAWSPVWGRPQPKRMPGSRSCLDAKQGGVGVLTGSKFLTIATPRTEVGDRLWRENRCFLQCPDESARIGLP